MELRTERPTGLLRVLCEDSAAGDAIRSGAGFVVSGDALDGYSRVADARVERVVPLASDRPSAGPLAEAIATFSARRRALLAEVTLRLRAGGLGAQPGTQEELFLSLAALDAAPRDVLHGCGDALDAYVAAHGSMLRAHLGAPPRERERALAAVCDLDLALVRRPGTSRDATVERARLLPLHPLFLSSERAGAMPPVIAAHDLSLNRLAAEGEPGFFWTGDSAGPPVAAVVRAMGEAAGLVRAAGGARFVLSLVDVAFGAAALDALVAALAERGATARGEVLVRFVASSRDAAPGVRVPSLQELTERTRRALAGALPTIALTLEPSVRHASDAGAADLAVVARRTPPAAPTSQPTAGAATYKEWLAAHQVDPEPSAVQATPVQAFDGAARVLLVETTPVEHLPAPEVARSDRDGSGHASVDPPRGALAAAGNGLVPYPTRARREEEAAGTRLVASRRGAYERRAADAPEPDSNVRSGAEDDAVSSPAPPGTPPVSDAAIGGQGAGVIQRAALVGAAARAAWGAAPPGGEASLVAAVVRRVVSLRGTLFRHALIAEVTELLAPAFPDQNLRAEVEAEVDALVDLGDLVERSVADRGPRSVEVASALMVIGEAVGRALLLGGAEAALPPTLRARSRPAGRVRAVDLDGADGGLVEEFRFNGGVTLGWDAWARAPEEVEVPILLARLIEGGKEFSGDGGGAEVFDPRRDPWIYRDRFRAGALGEVLARDGWAVARESGRFGARSLSLLRLDGGVRRRAEVTRESFVRAVGACAALASGGHRLLARREGDAVRLHFPPPPWLARLLSSGAPADPRGALVAARLPGGLAARVERALGRLLFCEVRVQ